MIKHLPIKLRVLRIEKNLSQKEVADKLGISPSTICCYETGKKIPSLEILLSLADLYDFSMDYL